MTGVLAYLKTALRGEGGATMVEYGFVVALIALVALLAVSALGDKVLSFFTSVSF